MKCPYCESLHSRVLDSRETDDNSSIRRRRECEACGRRFTTYERYEEATLVVVKKDLSREKFDRGKLLRGIERACQKRPVSPLQQEAIVNSIERELRSRGEAEVTSSEIGDLVLQYLKGLDQVAYVRFASVFKEFQDVSRFAEELQGLRERTVPLAAGRTEAATSPNQTNPPTPEEGNPSKRRRPG